MADEVGKHEILGTELVFDGRVFKAYLDRVRLPNGKDVTWERVAHPGAVGMVPLLPDGRIVMVRQYRNAVRGELLEIPAGKLEPGESPYECAQRELVEEIGYRAGDMMQLAQFYNSPGYSDECFYLYAASDLTEARGATVEDEFLEPVTVDLEAALEMISTGLLKDAKSIIGITLATMYRKDEIRPYNGGERPER